MDKKYYWDVKYQNGDIRVMYGTKKEAEDYMQSDAKIIEIQLH